MAACKPTLHSRNPRCSWPITTRRAARRWWIGAPLSSAACGCSSPQTSRASGRPTSRWCCSTSTASAPTAPTGSDMKAFVFMLLLSVHGLANALNIFACEPEWGALATEIGGERAKVYVAITGLQDPHRVDARPSLIARARSADLMVCTGAQLEEG